MFSNRNINVFFCFAFKIRSEVTFICWWWPSLLTEIEYAYRCYVFWNALWQIVGQWYLCKFQLNNGLIFLNCLLDWLTFITCRKTATASLCIYLLSLYHLILWFSMTTQNKAWRKNIRSFRLRTQTLVNETCERFYCNGLDFSKQKPDAKSRK